VDRIDFSNDSPTTASPRGPLSATRYSISATANANFGWFGGGWAPGRSSRIDRIDFSNDTATASIRGTLSTARNSIQSASNSNYGWFAGGYLSPAVSTVDRIDFANDSPTAASPRGPLSIARAEGAGAGNSSYGWFAGAGPTVLSSVNRIDFSNDSPTTASLRGPLSQARSLSQSGASNYVKTVPSTQYPTQGLGTNEALAGYGWMMGGLAPGTVLTSTVDRLDYSNDNATASVRGPLGRTRFFNSGMGNANYGWAVAGSSDFTGNFVSSVDRIDYANDSPASSVARSPLASVRYRHSSTGNANFGWTIGGFNSPGGTLVSWVDRTDYSNDLVSPLPRGPLPVTLYMFGATANADYGWVGGGGTAPSVSSVYRIDFSNDSPAASTRGPLTLARFGVGASGNANYGWFGGGLGPTSIIDRVDFSNDNPTSASVRGPLSAAGPINLSSAGNAAYGWFIAFVSTFSRIDFSNDSPATASSRGSISGRTAPLGITSNYVKPSLNQQALQLPFTGNRVDGTFGWAMGGAPGGGGSPLTSRVDRIDFANDSPTSSSVRGPLAFTQSYTDSVGNANFGWMLGGASLFNNVTSQVNRITFANDTATGSERGRLTIVRGNAGAAANNNYAWVAAGGDFANSTRYSSVDRIDLANDSPSTASPRGFLPQAISNMHGLSNEFYGWFAGGTIAGPASSSSVQRIDFANDSPTAASARGPLSGSRYASASLSNTAYGWMAGGIVLPFAALSSVQRIDFANDSPTAASARGPLSSPLFECAGANNQFLGWVMGGGNFPATSLVQRIDFSNDLAAVSIRGNMAENKYGHGGVSNYVKTTPIFNVTQYSKGASTVGTGAGTFGWFVGGSPLSTNVSRIDFNNDTATGINRGSITAGRTQFAGASSNANYGWFVGGYFFTPPATSTVFSRVDRIDYANDNSTALTRADIPIAARSGAGCGNTNFGWLAVGSPSISNIYRINYSNDLTSPLTRGLISYFAQYRGAVSSQNFGYWSGGFVPVSTVTRMDFSNDNETTLNRGPTLLNKQFLMGLSNSVYGWWCGGNTNGPDISNVDRMDFANDLSTMSARANLPTAFSGNGSSGNQFYGWLTNTGNIFRIDYSNDLAAASPRGAVPTNHNRGSANSNYTK
jgi:hypothetical protein